MAELRYSVLRRRNESGAKKGQRWRKARLSTVLMRSVRRNPRFAAKATMLAAAHAGEVVELTRLKRRISQLASNGGGSLDQAELGAAAGGIVEIVVRARKLGLANAFADKAVAHRLDDTLGHLSKALAHVERGRRRRRLRRTLTAGLGIGAAGYGTWRLARNSRTDRTRLREIEPAVAVAQA